MHPHFDAIIAHANLLRNGIGAGVSLRDIVFACRIPYDECEIMKIMSGRKDTMKSRKKLVNLMALAVLSLALLTGCGEKKWPMQVTVVNRTTCPIADIRLSLASEEYVITTS